MLGIFGVGMKLTLSPCLTSGDINISVLAPYAAPEIVESDVRHMDLKYVSFVIKYVNKSIKL